MKYFYTDLTLFDGEGGAASAEGTGAESTNTQAETVVYGKQNTEEAHLANEQTEPIVDRKKAFEELINGEYKDLYTKKTQDMINKRFKQTKEAEATIAKQNAVLDILKQRYGVSETDDLMSAIEDDDSYWENAADDAGMTVEQYKKLQKLERENKALLASQQQAINDARVQQQISEWTQEAEGVKEVFPDFDLQAEAQNPQFLNMLKSGVPMEHAYKVMHYDELMTGTINQVQASTEKRVVDSIRAKGNRPVENGAMSASGFIVKDDPSKLTKKDRAEIIKRVRHGDTISF